jgi:hypothetical protein
MLATMAYQLEKMYDRYDAAAEARKMEVALVEMPVAIPGQGVLQNQEVST